ncbi:hypothetical protein LshimejAT787_1201160 [Lyophyllum shimeji]|uniref:Uncharacterized protein n=1 Tax=Lyophyllum shimeji TaxID=47721 RepID=A0A9P3PTP0_LYOSH|nr:hypothetical protein LshimejAT787_1201160 [Lyophyllum shimeji]
MDVTIRYIEPSHITTLQPRSGTVKEVVEKAEKELTKKIESSFGVRVQIDPKSTAVFIDGHLRDHREPKFASQAWARITEKSVVIDAYPITGEDGSTSTPLLEFIKECTKKRPPEMPVTAQPARFTSESPREREGDKAPAPGLEKVPLVEVREPADSSQVVGVGHALRETQAKLNSLIDENASMSSTIRQLTAETSALKTEVDNVRTAMSIVSNALRETPTERARTDPVAAAVENARAMANSKEAMSDTRGETARHTTESTASTGR